ncbi:MAG: carboxypeptidase-like regulatory domain-containing protein [Acidobacteriota bacterium]
MNRSSFIIIILIVLSPILFSHGVDIVIIKGGTGIEAKYDSGDPITQAEVTVYSPGNNEEPFQSGVTDRNGRFLFSPDSEGTWKVVVNDLTGHGGTKKIEIDPISKIPAGNAEKPLSRGIKVLSGISVIFGLSGILFYLLAVRERKRGVDAHS